MTERDDFESTAAWGDRDERPSRPDDQGHDRDATGSSSPEPPAGLGTESDPGQPVETDDDDNTTP
jgi:hypothetical protein